jgi:hypothetical protein
MAYSHVGFLLYSMGMDIIYCSTSTGTDRTFRRNNALQSPMKKNWRLASIWKLVHHYTGPGRMSAGDKNRTAVAAMLKRWPRCGSILTRILRAVGPL